MTLRTRSVRTLAWLGDALFEQEVRHRLARRGDWPVDRLDRARAMIVRSEAQAELLAEIEPVLEDAELDVVRRGRNAEVRGGGRGARDVKAYRAATALEALVAWWHAGDAAERMHAVLDGPLARRVGEAIEGSSRPRRG